MAENNFLEYVALLPDYATELAEAGETEAACILLEAAAAANADSRKIDNLLIKLKEKLSAVH